MSCAGRGTRFFITLQCPQIRHLKYDSAWSKHIQGQVIQISKKGRKITGQEETSEPFISYCPLRAGKEKQMVCSQGGKRRDLGKVKR